MKYKFRKCPECGAIKDRIVNLRMTPSKCRCKDCNHVMFPEWYLYDDVTKKEMKCE